MKPLNSILLMFLLFFPALAFSEQEIAFEINVSGKSSDGCNTTSASINDVVASSKVVFNNVSWMSTEMACLSK